MYTVGTEMLPSPELVAEAIELMREDFATQKEFPYVTGFQFTGEVYQDTPDSAKFQVACYSGRITSMVFEPPAFNVLVEEAWLETAKCDCPGVDIDRIFEDFEEVMEEAELSQELDELAGAPTVDPHIEPIPLEPNTEITIRFDRLGWYGVHGILG